MHISNCLQNFFFFKEAKLNNEKYILILLDEKLVEKYIYF